MRALVIMLLAACASASAVPSARFADKPAVTSVDDRKHVAAAPKPRTYNRMLAQFRGNVVRPAMRALELEAPRRALGVNALDEVPNSTWFTNRRVTADELRAGPGTAGEPQKPLTVKSTKVGGRNIGFIVVDARGEKYILKFDKKGFPETETAAGVIAGRLLWGMGWNVPEDHILYFTASDLVLAKDAKVKDVFGHARPLRRAELERMLAQVDVQADGRYRSLASHMLAGTWLGGHPGSGTRSDDPNDRIPHERRRDLRGSYAMFAWLDHIDIKEDNSLDMFVADPGEPARQYVKHYQIDFGSALGSQARTAGNQRAGHEYVLDVSAAFGAFATLGLRERGWEARRYSALRGVGLYDVTGYDPGTWKPLYAGYEPFYTADRIDQAWASRILIRFTREELRGAVEAGRLSDPRATDELVDRLAERQRVTAKYWFERTSPLDGFRVEDTSLCFDDLMTKYALSAAPVKYTATVFDYAGAQVAAPAVERTCVPTTSDGIVKITTTRSGRDLAVFIYLAQGRVIGIWRQ